MGAGATASAAVGPGEAAGRPRAAADPPASERATDPQLRSAPAGENGQAVGDAVGGPLDAADDHDGAQLAVADLSFAIGHPHGPAELAAALAGTS